MAIRVKPASYGPLMATMDSEDVLHFGDSVESLSATPPMVDPGAMLLYSIASCMILSLQTVAKRKKIAIEPFTIEVTAHKSETLPLRFDRFDVSLCYSSHIKSTVAEQLLKSAKSICTISNSLSGTFKLSVKNGEEYLCP
jgi:uncharacterized OsmC-like protein